MKIQHSLLLRHVRKILQHLALAACCASLAASAYGADPLTAAATVAGMRAVSNDLFAQARATGNALLGEAGTQVQAVVDRVEQILGDKITKPIAELNQTLQNELKAAEFIVGTIRSSLDKLPACVGNEGQLLVANIKAGVQSAINRVPLSNGEPIAYLVYQKSNRLPYTIIRPHTNQEDIDVTVQGANLWGAGRVCDGKISATARRVRGDGAPVRLTVISHNQEAIDLAMPHGLPQGKWSIDVQADTSRFIVGCLSPKTQQVSTTMEMRDRSTWVIEPRVTPICKGYEVRKYPYSGLCQRGALGSHEACSRRYEIPEAGWTYQSHTFDITYNRRGDSGTATASKSGNGVQVAGEVRGRKNNENRAGLVTWAGEIVYMKSLQPNPQPPIVLKIDGQMSNGDSKAFSILDYKAPAGCALEKWALGGTLTPTGGNAMAIADTNGIADGTVVATGAGAKLSFNGITKTGTAEIAPTSCLAN